MKRFSGLIVFLLVALSSQHVFAYQEVKNGEIDGSRVEVFDYSLNTGEIVYQSLEFDFHSIAVVEPTGLEVRFYVHGEWGEWEALGLDEPGFGSFSSLVFTVPTRRFSLRSSVRRSVTAYAFYNWVPDLVRADLRGGPKSFEILSRSEWGADEQLRVRIHGNGGHEEDDFGEGKDTTTICDPIEAKFVNQFQVDKTIDVTSSGEELRWPLDYSKQVKKIVVHHTAAKMKDINGDGRIDSRDYALAVKNIYTYHTVSRGWGDVGYNFLVDPEGNVYEGRAGGDKVVGGHVLCQNTSTVGIAVMGDFEATRVPRDGFMGLARIVQHQTKRHGINPRGMSQFRGMVLPHILGHKDLAAVTKAEIGRGGTLCPGEHLHGMLNRLRNVVKSGSFDGAELGFIPYKSYDYQLAKQVQKVEMKPLARASVTVSLQNIGLEDWRDARLVFQKRALGVSTVSSVMMNEQRVSTGGVGTFTIPLESTLKGGSFRVPYKLKVMDEEIEGLLVLPVIVERPVYTYDVVSSDGLDGPFLTGDKRNMKVRVRNTGNFPWLAEGENTLSLRAVRMRGNRILVDRRGKSFEIDKNVGIGEEVVFTWEEELPNRVGTFLLNYVPVIGRSKGLIGDAIGGRLQIEEPRLALRAVLRDRIKFLKPGEEVRATYTITNIGNFSWEPGKTWIRFEQDTEELLVGEAKNSGAATRRLQQELVSKNIGVRESIDVERVIRAPYKGNTYLLEGAVRSAAYGGSEASFSKKFLVRGRAVVKGKKVNQSEKVLDIAEREQAVFVEYENKGNVPWYNSGEGRALLVVEDSPSFPHKSWETRKTVGSMVQKRVDVGEVARFEFNVRLPGRVIRSVEDEFGIRVDGQKVIGARSAVFGVERGKRIDDPDNDPSVRQKPDRSPNSGVNNISGSLEVVPSVRVLISSFDLPFAEVSSDGKLKVWRSSDGSVKEVEGSVVVDSDTLSSSDVVRVRAVDGEYLEFENWDRIPSWSTSGSINDNSFRTVLEFRKSGSGDLMLINELSLEYYMRGISEEPESDDLPQEKRKVIAVLARSYALHYISSDFEKFPGKPYNASDDPAVFQKYTGYGFEQRSPKWQQALADTDREVLKYDGEVLRAAYFSCSDGRTKMPEEARFGMDYFSLVSEVYQSVADPLGNDPVRSAAGQCGHGVGLSGLGATEMARQGQNYRDIIDYYYQNVEVGNY